MQIIEVKDNSAIADFHKVAYQIYKDDPNWIAPLEVMVDSTFDPKKERVL